MFLELYGHNLRGGESMHYYNDGADGFLWDPLFRLKVGLTPVERALIHSPALRRLRRIAAYGPGAMILPMGHTLFDHTTGVFALAAHFHPQDWELRAAALLTSVGSLPFRLDDAFADGYAEVSATVAAHGLDGGRVAALASGAAPSPLYPKADRIGLVKLDQWLRDTESCGIGAMPAYAVLPKLGLTSNAVDTPDEAVARELIRRIAANMRIYLKPRVLAVEALVRQALATVTLTVHQGDDDALALAGPLGRLVQARPWAGEIQPVSADQWAAVAPPNVHFVSASATRCYIAVTAIDPAELLLGGQPVSVALKEAAAVYATLPKLKQAYVVDFPE